MEDKSFSLMGLDPALLQAVKVLGFTEMTPIQAQSLPLILQGRDVVGQARTGSGKTAAYGLGLLSRIDPALTAVQALVLCPTRELADQIGKEIRALARMMPNIKLSLLNGGIAMRPQLASLKHPPHIIVGMAGRVLEHLTEGSLDLSQLRVLVLDEADRMLDADFAEASREIIVRTPPQRQTLMFSATFPDSVRAVSKRLQKDPVEVIIDNAPTSAQVEQHFYEVDYARRLDALAFLLSQHRPESALVFCHTKNDAADVAAQLDKRGYSVLELHGDVDQRDRDEVLVRFANGSCRVLVATDVAARGLDIKELAAVLSYELPNEPDVHVHRVGRTGRAGRSGLALHLVSPKERSRIAPLEAKLQQPIRLERLNLPAHPKDAPVPAGRATLCIDGGRRDKMRPGDILGALTGEGGLPAEAVGRINTYDTRSYVAIDKKRVAEALKRLRERPIKGRKFRVRPIE